MLDEAVRRLLGNTPADFRGGPNPRSHPIPVPVPVPGSQESRAWMQNRYGNDASSVAGMACIICMVRRRHG